MSKNSILDINDILNDYSLEIQEGITNAAIEIAEKGVKELKVTSPKKTGKYSKGWRVNKEFGRRYIHATIYNATDWQLTHLLEKSHLLRNGKKSKPIVHIEPVEQKCIREFQEDVEHIIKNGG